MGGLSRGIVDYSKGLDFWDGFDYQATLDAAVAKEGINPNSKWLVANSISLIHTLLPICIPVTTRLAI